MEYIVIKSFTDKDDKHKYKVGDRYPNRGFAKKERAEELSSRKNLRGEVLIKALKNTDEDERDRGGDEEVERSRRVNRRENREVRETIIND